MPRPDAAALSRAEARIVDIPDFPSPGILFRDIAPVLDDAQALRAVTDALAAPFLGGFDAVAGVESRGFLLAGAIAIAAGTGLVPIRKAGKLPRPAASVSYALEYGLATIEVQADLPPGSRVLLVDDVLATGGTLVAGRRVLEEVGYAVAGVAVLLELEGLGGRAAVGDVHAVFRA